MAYFAAVCLCQQVMILNQPIRAGATDPSHNFLFFFYFLIERLSVEPVWFSFPHFVGNLCSRRVVQCPVCCLKERKELLTQMAHSQDDAPLARGSLADSEEILLPPAAPRGWEECILSIAAVCAASLKMIFFQ